MARAGDLFLTDSVPVVNDGFVMVSADCGAIEARFVKIASSQDVRINPQLIVLDLDAPGAFSCRRPFASKTAAGPGCIPWNSPLRASLMRNLPVVKIQRCYPPAPSPMSVKLAEAGRPQVGCLTAAFLAGLGLVPMENRVLSHCWWSANACHTKLAVGKSMLQVLDFACNVKGLDLASSLSYLSSSTSTQQISFCVAALAQHYPTGLLIAHSPDEGAFLFSPNLPPKFLSYYSASLWARRFPSTPVMLFTREQDQCIGHFEFCQRACPPVPDFLDLLSGRNCPPEQRLICLDKGGSPCYPAPPSALPWTCSDPECPICQDHFDLQPQLAPHMLGAGKREANTMRSSTEEESPNSANMAVSMDKIPCSDPRCIICTNYIPPVTPHFDVSCSESDFDFPSSESAPVPHHHVARSCYGANSDAEESQRGRRRAAESSCASQGQRETTNSANCAADAGLIQCSDPRCIICTDYIPPVVSPTWPFDLCCSESALLPHHDFAGSAGVRKPMSDDPIKSLAAAKAFDLSCSGSDLLPQKPMSDDPINPINRLPGAKADELSCSESHLLPHHDFVGARKSVCDDPIDSLASSGSSGSPSPPLLSGSPVRSFGRLSGVGSGRGSLSPLSSSESFSPPKSKCARRFAGPRVEPLDDPIEEDMCGELLRGGGQPSVSVLDNNLLFDGCSCVGVYGCCMCGFLQRASKRARTSYVTAAADPIEDASDASDRPLDLPLEACFCHGVHRVCHCLFARLRSRRLRSGLVGGNLHRQARGDAISAVADDPIEDASDDPVEDASGASERVLDLPPEACFCHGVHRVCHCLFARLRSSTAGGNLHRQVQLDATSTVAADDPTEGDLVLSPPVRNLPSMVGGMVHSPDVETDSMVSLLCDMGIPIILARAAAAAHPTDINLALDWACASDRRHIRRVACDSVISLSDDDTAPASSSDRPVAVPVPGSWTSPAPPCQPSLFLPGTTGCPAIEPASVVRSATLAVPSSWTLDTASTAVPHLMSMPTSVPSPPPFPSCGVSERVQSAPAMPLAPPSSFNHASAYPPSAAARSCSTSIGVPSLCPGLLHSRSQPLVSCQCPATHVSSAAHHALSSHPLLSFAASPEHSPPTPANWSPISEQDAAECMPGAESGQDSSNSSQPGEQLPHLPPQISKACFLEDPEAEVHHWFTVLANSRGAAAHDESFWLAMPLYSQYIEGHSLETVAGHALESIRRQRGLCVTIEQAAKLPCVLGYTTVLPVAVMCKYLHAGCGLPAIFVFDLFQSCLASCQNKHLEVALYAQRSKAFTCKARWWACPTGDPNAGKSPTCSFVMNMFRQFVQSAPDSMYSEEHWIGVGNNNRIQNRLRLLEGTLLIQGPESKPILDPNFPSKKTVDTGKYLDLTRWLESANGGRFEWGTGQDEKARMQKSKDPGLDSLPSSFDPTNINLCLFQQFKLFEDWWCQVESLHQCGFSARILMTPTARAIVDRCIGLQDPSPMGHVMQRIWRWVATHYGPQCTLESNGQLCTSITAQAAIRSFYYDLVEEEEQGGWGSATKSALGKMEYHVPSSACLTSFAAASLASMDSLHGFLDDNAIKCALRHFDLRVMYSCSIVDSTVRQAPGKACGKGAAMQNKVKPMTVRVLEACVKDPILLSHMSHHFSCLKGSEKFEERVSILQQLERLGLGEVRETRRCGDARRSVAFYRHSLSPAVAESLRDLGVCTSFWHPSHAHSQVAAEPTLSDAGGLSNPMPPMPLMNGSGRKRKASSPAPARPESDAPSEAKRKKAQLVDPIEIVGPFTTAAVESSINAALATAGTLVHNKPLEVKANAAKRKSKISFQLNCAVCQHHTCSWRGLATMRTGQRGKEYLDSWQMCEGQHGDAKKAKANSGRKPKTQARNFSIQEKIDYNGGLDNQSLVAAIRKHFADRPLADSLLVSCRPRKPTKKGATCTFQCSTHFHAATGKDCPWAGSGKLVSVGGRHELQLKYEAPDIHAPDERFVFGTLTWKQRQAALRSEDKTTPAVLERVLKVTQSKEPHKAPKPGQVSRFASRMRATAKAKNKAEGMPPSSKGLSCSDFEFCRDFCNSGLGIPQGMLLPNSPALVKTDTNLRVVDMQLSSDQVCVPLICPALLDRVLSLLPAPWNLKVSTDGTYRLMFDSYALLSFGVNVKHWSKRKSVNIYSFRSSFVPLGFALADAENGEAYAHLTQTIQKAAQHLGHNFQPQHILQWHGDMHKGIEAARRKVAPDSIRVSDWAHVTGATSLGPAGFHGLVVKHLAPEYRQTVVPWLLQFCRISKQWPLRLFHVLWTSIFADLNAKGQTELCAQLQRQYFYVVAQPEGQLWDAGWRSAPDRVMPGTDAGSAPQESWHGNVLKPALGCARRKPADVAAALAKSIVVPQLRILENMATEEVKFQDWPGVGSFLDQPTLSGNAALQKEGRTPGKTLLQWGKHTRFEDADGNVWMLVPSSKLKRDWQSSKKQKVFKLRNPVALPPNSAMHFSSLVSAQSVVDVEAALESLGVYNAQAHSVTCWRTVAKLLDDWRCVVCGPFVASYWLSKGIDPEPHNHHRVWLCYGCHVASLWGPCEHAYCCMEHEGQSSASALLQPKPKGRPAKTRARAPNPSPQLVPGHCHPSLAAPAAASAPQLRSARPSSTPTAAAENEPLRKLLRSLSLGHFILPMEQQGVTLTALRRLSFSDFHSLFGMRIGDAEKIMDALCEARVSAIQQTSWNQPSFHMFSFLAFTMNHGSMSMNSVFRPSPVHKRSRPQFQCMIATLFWGCGLWRRILISLHLTFSHLFFCVTVGSG